MSCPCIPLQSLPSMFILYYSLPFQYVHSGIVYQVSCITVSVYMCLYRPGGVRHPRTGCAQTRNQRALSLPYTPHTHLARSSPRNRSEQVSIAMIANLPAGEKQAFFGLLDEYFAARPHLLPAPAASTQVRSGGGGIAGMTDRATAAAGNVAGNAANMAVQNHIREQMSRKGFGSNKGPPPPAPSSGSKPGFASSAYSKGMSGVNGLVAGKSFGGLNLGPKTQQPMASPPPKQPSARTLPPPARTGSGVPSPQPATPALPHGTIGTAEVLYDYGDGSDPDDLTAREGESIYLVEHISDDWWRATSHDSARHGIIPASYVRAQLA